MPSTTRSFGHLFSTPGRWWCRGAWRRRTSPSRCRARAQPVLGPSGLNLVEPLQELVGSLDGRVVETIAPEVLTPVARGGRTIDSSSGRRYRQLPLAERRRQPKRRRLSILPPAIARTERQFVAAPRARAGAPPPRTPPPAPPPRPPPRLPRQAAAPRRRTAPPLR